MDGERKRDAHKPVLSLIGVERMKKKGDSFALGIKFNKYVKIGKCYDRSKLHVHSMGYETPIRTSSATGNSLESGPFITCIFLSTCLVCSQR